MKFIMVFLMALTLSACSKQPSEQDIKKALEVSVTEENNRIKQMIMLVKQDEENPQQRQKTSNESVNEVIDTIDQMKAMVKSTVGSTIPELELMIYELIDAKKLGDCEQKKDTSNFRCKVKATVKNKNGETTNTLDISFVRSESGDWVVLFDDEPEENHSK